MAQSEVKPQFIHRANAEDAEDLREDLHFSANLRDLCACAVKVVESPFHTSRVLPLRHGQLK